MDHSFEEFMRTTQFGENWNKKFIESDMFYWEHRMSQWASSVKQDFDISHDTTVIYNNRYLLDLLLNYPLEERINDIPQKLVIKNLDKRLYDLNVKNDNPMKSKKRIILEKIFWMLNRF